MTGLDDQYLAVVRTLTETLHDASIDWALTGSTSFALQGVPLDPGDVDLQTTESGAYYLEEQFSGQVRESVTFVESEEMRSHLGELVVDGISVEVIGDLQKRDSDGSWEPPVDVTDHREFVEVQDLRVPVLSLDYEAQAYERLGRTERASLLREYVE